mmetsp:Transcript_8077/g.24922  ORF Transcript_8077/g.24922 Transcript_8077/m.24922 type:complete len:98 (-) Transcript_8077:574-867(-)
MRTMLADAGFVDVDIVVKPRSEEIIGAWMPGSQAEKYVSSAYVTASKPASPDAPAAPRDDVFRRPTREPVVLDTAPPAPAPVAAEPAAKPAAAKAAC